MKSVPLSIVIIVKNEAGNLVQFLQKARKITHDIVVVDSGSTDATVLIARENGCSVLQTGWDGYGANKNKGIRLARYDWILSLDADEMPDDVLVHSLQQLRFDRPEVVYNIRFRSYYGTKKIRYGCWGNDHHIRLFNREQVRWAEPVVHETLVLPAGKAVKTLDGRLDHFSARNPRMYRLKARKYARLSARKYFTAGKQATLIKLYLAPAFQFFRSYFLFLGFLDGREGWELARISFAQTRLKYHYLAYLENRARQKRTSTASCLPVNLVVQKA